MPIPSVSPGHNIRSRAREAMGKAFDCVIRELHDSGQSNVVREVIADE